MSRSRKSGRVIFLNCLGAASLGGYFYYLFTFMLLQVEAALFCMVIRLNCGIEKQVDSPNYEYYMPKFSKNPLYLNLFDLFDFNDFKACYEC